MKKSVFGCLGMFNLNTTSPAKPRGLLALALTMGLLAAGSASAGAAPTISTQPASASVYVGAKGAFSVVALGDAPLFYQWRTNGIAVSAATNAAYTTPVTTLANSGTVYSVIVSNNSGSVFSSGATLSVVAAAPRITTQPASATIYAGNSGTFSVVATGSVPMAYQWSSNGTSIASATNATYTTPVASIANSGTVYSVVITNSAGSATSTNATLNVLPASIPLITAQPTNTLAYIGYTATFTVSATGTPTLAYQWYTNGVKVTGATAASYKTPVLSAAYNALVYSVIVSNGYGPVTSSNATLTVVAPTAPSITTQPSSAVGVAGQKVGFSVVATGAPLYYQWRTNNGTLSGATGAIYSNTCSVAQNGYQFSVIVSNSMGSVTSAPATLYVVGALQIAFRAVTVGEIAAYGLPAGTRVAAGGPNVAIGEPAYLEAMITKGSTSYIRSVSWTLAHKANGSTSTNVLQASPLTTNVPLADVGDQIAYDLAGRAMLVPDAVGTNNNGDYVVVASVTWTNGTVFSATNTVYGSLYKGKDTCYYCHADKSNGYERTMHATAFTRKINGSVGAEFGPNCISCHTVGYDTSAGAVNGGFDDVAKRLNWKFPTNLGKPASAANNWKNMPAALKALANVQCENCHGPGWRHVMSGGDTNMITVSLSANNCSQCHDDPPFHVKKEEWAQSKHAIGPNVFSSRSSGSCAACHTTRGFIDYNDPGFVNSTGAVIATRGTYNEGITCEACHDPHSPGMGDAQLRNVPTTVLSNGFVAAKGGHGQICMRCHHDRGAATNLVGLTVAKVNTTHHGTQSDVLYGQNAYEFGLTMPGPAPHLQVNDTCVGCHMQDGSNVTPTNAQHHVGGHTYTLSWLNAATTTVPSAPGIAPYLTLACAPCHGNVTNVTFSGQIFTNTLVSCQAEVSNLLYQIAKMLDPTNTGLAVNTALISTAATQAGLAQRGAYYNWYFFTQDGSYGVHNPPYVKSVLRASLAAMGGASPLPYGSYPVPAGIASQSADGSGSSSGSGSGSSSGLSGSAQDAKSLAVSAGATSTSSKSGVWGTAPIQLSVTPSASQAPVADNQITLNPALELGYHPDPSVVGHPIKFQATPALEGNADWTDLGPETVASNAWHYQLISYRDATQRFFRVTAP